MIDQLLDPANVMRDHHRRHPDRGQDYCGYCGEPFPCEAHRLAAALAAEQAKVQRVREIGERYGMLRTQISPTTVLRALAGEG